MDKGRNIHIQVIVGGIVVLVLLFIGWWLTTKPSGDSNLITPPASSSSPAATAATNTNPMQDLSGEEVRVEDQAAGPSVSVESVTLPNVGWVAVRDENGRVLGAARFDPGVHLNVSVPLLRNTVTNASYQVLLYVDDGDKQFDLHKDTLITTAGGGVAGTTFRTW